MYRKLFVLFVVLLLVISLSCLFIYDKKIINEEKENNLIKDNVVYEQEKKYEEQMDFLGTLTIEKIGLNAQIKEGSSSEILKEYIGHIEETDKYDGNIGLAAHNRGNKYSYFSRINELDIGDEIIYESKFGQRRYIVKEKKEILETDWEMLNNTKENKITLITCIKNKVNQRLCVQAIQENL